MIAPKPANWFEEILGRTSEPTTPADAASTMPPKGHPALFDGDATSGKTDYRQIREMRAQPGGQRGVERGEVLQEKPLRERQAEEIKENERRLVAPPLSEEPKKGPVTAYLDESRLQASLRQETERDQREFRRNRGQ